MDTVRFEIPGRGPNGNPVLGFDGNGLVGNGTLLYVEPARETFSRAPITGQRVKNWGCGSLSELTGAALENCDAAVKKNALTPSTGRFEFTSAGAMHAYFRDQPDPDNGLILDLLPQAAINYINANPSHTYYIDAVLRLTAPPVKFANPTTGPWMTGFANHSGYTQSDAFFGYLHLSDSGLSDAANKLSYPTTAAGITNNSGSPTTNLLVQARVGRTGLPSNWSTAFRYLVNWVPPKIPGGNLQYGPSFILYSAMLKDLTVSGQTYSQMKDIRDAQVATDFGTGGRYDGETWTDPATVTW